MKPTLETIAEKTGYSISTVSRALTGKAEKFRISETAAETIRKTATELGYSPNIIAQNLRNGKTETIGLVVPDISNPYFAEISSVVVAEAKKHGYTTIVPDTMENESAQKDSVCALVSRKVEGMIIVPCGSDPSYLEDLNKRVAPIILVDRYFENSPLPFVVTNNWQGGVDGTNILIRNGHKRIACIQGNLDSMPNRKRTEGYLYALKKAGLEEFRQIVGNDFTVQNGYIETKLLLNSSDSRQRFLHSATPSDLEQYVPFGKPALRFRKTFHWYRSTTISTLTTLSPPSPASVKGSKRWGVWR